MESDAVSYKLHIEERKCFNGTKDSKKIQSEWCFLIRER